MEYSDKSKSYNLSDVGGWTAYVLKLSKGVMYDFGTGM